jgi:hypothetical protein
VWLFEQALRGKPGFNYWWVAPTYGVAGIAFRRLKAWLRESLLPSHAWRAREDDQSVEIAGRVIWFKGADKPDALYGEDVFAAVIDEATRCKEDSWPAVRSTLTATRGPIKLIGNVRGRHNWAYKLARKAQSGAENFGYFKLTAWDAVEGGVLDGDEVRDAEATLLPDVFRELYLAEPSDDGGNPFGAVAIAAAEMKSLASGPVMFWGVDLAKSVDFTAICGLNADGETCVLERWRSDWDQTRRRLLKIMADDKPAEIDSTGVGDPIVEDLSRKRENTFAFKFTSQTKQQLMEGLAAALQQKTVRFPAGWLRNELDAFEYEYTRTGVRYSAPEGLHDDGVCALALAVHCRATHRPVKVHAGRILSAGISR